MPEKTPKIPPPEVPPEVPPEDENTGPGSAAAHAPVADPAALSVAHLARLLALPEDKVLKHIAAGAPSAADGTINLVRYVAWLNRRLKENDGPEV
ncbi:MAG: hypothetical protein GC164_14110 [Phycisphaera sp.]|nr:hypothetical protein [Phycisphaera sp.]